jgi:hypothetical protein
MWISVKTEQYVLERTNPPTPSFFKLFKKLNSLLRYDIAQHYRIIH